MTGPVLSLEQAKPGSVGRIPDGELAIRDDNGGSLRPGQVGQVMLRGPSVMPGYLLDDIEGEPSGLVDGWLATGDLGSVDERRASHHRRPHQGDHQSRRREDRALRRREGAARPPRGARGGGIRRAACAAGRECRRGRRPASRRRGDVDRSDRLRLRSAGAVPEAAARPHRRQPAGRSDRQDLAAPALRRLRRRQAGHAAAGRAAGNPDRRDLAAAAEARRHRHGRRLLRDRRRFAAGHRDAAGGRGGDASSHQPVGHPRPAHHPRAVRQAGRRGGGPGRGDDQGEVGRRARRSSSATAISAAGVSMAFG